MERKKIEKEACKGFELDMDYFDDYKKLPIVELKNFIHVAQTNKATHLRFYGSSSCDGGIYEIMIQPIIIEEESDEEYNLRVKIENSRRFQASEAKKKREIELYIELKRKYGDE